MNYSNIAQKESMLMEIEIFEALKSVGVDDTKAKAVVTSINNTIDRRYTLHAEKLATKGDIVALEAKIDSSISSAKFDIIKWLV